MAIEAGPIRASQPRASHLWRRARTWLLPLILLLCVTLPHLGDGDWQRSDGAWYGAIGLQAWRTGDLISLKAAPGEFYFNKPPLPFWISGLALHILGPGPVAARLPTILAAAGCVLLTVSIARPALGRRGAMWAGIVLALTYEFFRRTREISLDMWQALFLLMALRLIVGAIVAPAAGRGALCVALSGLPVGLALMCKPLVGLAALPLFAAMLVCAGRWRLLPWLAASIPLAAAVAAPWHIAMIQIHGDAFTGQYFGKEVADRAAGSQSVNPRAVGRWWFYLEKLATGYWPWILPLVGLGVMKVRARLRRVNGRVLLACAIWAGGWILLLSIFPDRRDRYGLVFYPALAVLPAAWLVRNTSNTLNLLTRAVERRGACVAPILAGIFALLPVRVQEPPSPHWTALFAFLRAEGSPQVWQGGMISHRGARLYLETGRWPVPTIGPDGTPIASPPSGSLIIYHGYDWPRPGPGEQVAFQSGELTLTRLTDGATWQPRFSE